ncbi:hypothetical protein ALP12_200313 [Pseudomonas savastanoi pv. phaseolicola]|nr:hypothetical protein ALP12_200313 [Pseudomonas savastanoi pv. phaseolicola]
MEAKIPDDVVNAARLNFDIGITAYLHHPEVCGFSLTGRVYFDCKDRFQNGSPDPDVRCSRVCRNWRPPRGGYAHWQYLRINSANLRNAEAAWGLTDE